MMSNVKAKDSKPQYANWVSQWIPLSSGIITVLLSVVSVMALDLGKHRILVWLSLSIFAAIFCFFTMYMVIARRILAYDGGGVQSKVLDGVLSYLDTLHWNGEGKLLDIGCGSGAMSIKAAKKFPNAEITGIDYWGVGWDYSQELCEKNAKLEGAVHISFERGDAAKLNFRDGTFDVAISNFVFHEVRSQPDKLALVREALRVIKPGGYFVFEDVFYAKSHYGDIQEFVKALESDVSEIHFADMRRPSYAPAFLDTPLILGQMGLIYGRK